MAVVEVVQVFTTITLTGQLQLKVTLVEQQDMDTEAAEMRQDTLTMEAVAAAQEGQAVTL
jgi:hypothetical protein